MKFERNLKCPVCGHPLVQNPNNGARYTCSNADCILIEVWFRRVIYDSSVGFHPNAHLRSKKKVEAIH